VLTLISGNPFGEVFTVPYIGLTCLAILIAAVLCFFGVIHASSFGLNAAPMVMFGYLGMAVVMFLMSVYKKEDNVLVEED